MPTGVLEMVTALPFMRGQSFNEGTVRTCGKGILAKGRTGCSPW